MFDSLKLDTEPLIFGDPAYKGAFSVLRAFVRQPQKPLTSNQQWFNCTMSSDRISIKQLFRRTITLTARTKCYSIEDEGSFVDCTIRRY